MPTLRGSQAKLAAETGLSMATVSQILAGRRPPSRRAMAALAAYFRVDPSAFLRPSGAGTARGSGTQCSRPNAVKEFCAPT
jgi:transcriptional regulator with XRE-family HTH domain